MICLVIPHPHTDIAWDEVRVFDDFDAADHFLCNKARRLIVGGGRGDWGSLIVYEGSGKLKPIRSYTYSRDHDCLIRSP
jgi:hypothetical protein